MSILKYILHPSRIAKAGRRMAISGLLYIAAGVFIFASIIMGSIELGSQIANGSSLQRSGLWISALFVFGLAALSAGAGRYLTLRHREERQRPADEIMI